MSGRWYEVWTTDEDGGSPTILIPEDYEDKYRRILNISRAADEVLHAVLLCQFWAPSWERAVEVYSKYQHKEWSKGEET